MGAVLLSGGTPTLLPAPADRPDGEEGTAPLPSVLYEVPYGHPDVTDEPLGGPASVVYAGSETRRGFFFSRHRTISYVVGAERDVVRAVGLGEGRWGDVALSPDGTRLALGSGWAEVEEVLSPTLTVVDVVTGGSSDVVFPDLGMGGSVINLLWMPEGDHVAADVVVTTSRSEGDGNSATEGEIRPVHVDLTTGEWVERSHESPLAFSADGSVEVRIDPEGDAVIADVDGPVTASMPVGKFRTDASWAFSPDGAQVAALTSEGSWPEAFFIEIFDTSTGDQVGTVAIGELEEAALLGWGERGFVLFTEFDGEAQLDRLDLPANEPPVRTHLIEVEVSAIGWPAVMIAHDYLDADVRTAEPPPSRINWTMWLEVVGLAMVVAMWIGGRRLVRRWRRQRPAVAG
jgi:hypothetical protein